ncbi:MAG: DUF1549 domain-containing protein [Acidobacteria bacterium]|nr:DUF1549 domain-containing protein [Acidobacteriota bacterium]
MKTAIPLLLAPALFWGAECTFQANPQEFLARESRHRRDIYQATRKIGQSLARGGSGRLTMAAALIPKRNFIDEEIFGKLERLNVPSAALTTDEEFLRRIYLDLTGTPPAPADIRAFLADTSETKRDTVIEKLLYSPQFVDKWAMWWGDLLLNVAFPANFDRQYNGRNSYHEWIRRQLVWERTIKEIASEAVTATGNTFDIATAGTNFPINGKTPNGPIQDTYDTMLKTAASAFLGVSHYDCVLCHNGRGHLELVSLWGSTATRLEAQKMAAFFARLDMPQRNLPATDFYYRSFDVRDRTSGTYDLNTNFGNRPDRLPVAALRNLTPEYRGGAAPSDSNWRKAFADSMVADPLFAMNFANRLWKELFGLPLVDPVDGLDPARLDPDNPPQAASPEGKPWALQATHPELLVKLGQDLARREFGFREFLRVLVRSSAYQLSSRYDDDWKFDYVPLFARHYPRRLEGEEVHDAIALATGYPGSYTVNNSTERFTMALRLPEPVEPRSNGAVAGFMNAFLRGNRDTVFRSQQGSILQQLNLMNDSFVLSRLTARGSPPLIAISKLATNEEVVEETFLLFLSRRPSEYEMRKGVEFLAGAKTPTERLDYIEDLAWVALNKVEFIFSY